jgi:hypothetical protein
MAAAPRICLLPRGVRAWSCASTSRYASEAPPAVGPYFGQGAVSGPMEEIDLGAVTRTAMWLVTFALLSLQQVTVGPQPSDVDSCLTFIRHPDVGGSDYPVGLCGPEY